MRPLLLCILFALILLPACDGDDSESGDTTAMDTRSDTTTTQDSSADTTTQDTTPQDTTPQDTTPQDTGNDTTAQDTMSGMCSQGPLAEPLPNCSPTPVPNSGDPYQDCVDRINQFRWECQCLPPLERWTDAESCTDGEAESDAMTGQPHGAFGACNERAQNECPGWGSVEQTISGCLQQMWDEGPPGEDPCTGQCFQDHGHYINMTNPAYTKVACGFHTTGGGQVWAIQNFSP